jgi:chromosome segregation ATPase
MQILKLTDMQALIANDTPDELVNIVIQARRDDPDLSKADVKKLIAGFDQARELVRDRDDRLDAMTEELTTIGGKLDEAKIENRRLLAERQALQQQIDRDKDSADMTKVELARVSQSVNSLQVKIANQERELENSHRELAEARTAVRVETKEVPTLPEEFTKMEDSIEEQLVRLRQVRKDLEAEQAQLAALQQQRAEEEAALGAARVIDQKFESTIARFGDFTSDFTTLQLLVTADGNAARFKPMFEALSDLVGRFRDELLAATRAA